MGARITGSGTGSGSSSYKVSITWIAWTIGLGSPYTDSGTGLTWVKHASGNYYDSVKFTHGLGTRDVIVDVIEMTSQSNPSSFPNYNKQYAGMDIGHDAHVVAERDTTNTVTLQFDGDNPTGTVYRVLVTKIG
tara:strand:+ start:16922 stop:17320 length:399 start_codon:yes stop_codon:yes gene_type:complete